MRLRTWVVVAILAVVTLASASLLLARAGRAAARTPSSGSSYHVAKKIPLGGEGGWDYLTYDPSGKRLFISRATRVMVVDPEKGTVIGEIPNTPGVHGIAVAEDLGKGFTSNGRENTLTVFDLKTLKETGKIKVDGENPDAILYDSASKRVFAFNGRSKNATVIDAKTEAVVGKIPLDGKPEFAAADGKGMVYVNIEDKSELTSIDASKAAVVHSWPLAPCTEPTGLAIDRKNRRLFAGCDNKMMAIVDADNGKVVATVPIGEGVDATEFDPKTELAFSSNGGDGTLTVIHEDSAAKFSVVENVPTQKYARTMALDPNSHTVYLVTAEIVETPATDGGRPKRSVKPDTFTLLVVSK